MSLCYCGVVVRGVNHSNGHEPRFFVWAARHQCMGHHCRMFGDSDDDDQASESGEPPVFTGEVRPCRVGGGRGVFATEDIPPGTLIIAEMPFLPWSSEDFSDSAEILRLLETVLISPPSLEVCRHLHPQTIGDCSSQEVVRMKEFLNPDRIQSLVKTYHQTEDDIIVLALVIQHNGFSTGLYHLLSYFNHSCAPNCIKFSPKNSYSPSEIWSTTFIPKDSELVICYCNPRETSSNAMRAYLLENHFFDCACPQCLHSKYQYDDDDAILSLILNLERELLHQVVDRESEIALQSKRIYRQVLDRGADVENPFLRVRLFKVGIQAAISSIQAYEAKGKEVNRECAVSLVKCSVLTFICQSSYLGNDHPDLIATLCDLNEALHGINLRFPAEVESILQFLHSSNFPKLGLNWSNTLQWCKKEAVRLKRLYSLGEKYPDARRIYGKLGRAYGGVRVVDS